MSGLLMLLGCESLAAMMDPEEAVRAELARGTGEIWQLRWSERGWFGIGTFGAGLRNGQGAPPELGTQREAVARCGLEGEEVFAAVVYAANNRVGPWTVDVLEAPSEEVGDCIARILEMAPWDREHPRGSAVALGLRTTGALVQAWRPEEPRASVCWRISAWGISEMSWGMSVDHYVPRLSCPSDEAIVRLDIEIVGGVATVRAEPDVPCVVERAEQMTPDILKLFDNPRVDPDYKSIRCEIVVPMERR